MNSEKIINVKLTELIGKNISGLNAQITNPIYLHKPGMMFEGSPEKWRTLIKIKTYTERGKKWIELYWKPEHTGLHPDCGFTGSTIESDLCTIQFKQSEFNKIN